jgi:hypothetical protein
MTDRNRSGLLWAGIFVLGAILGIVVLSALRFAGQPPLHAVHYHANWALFVDGERVDLTANRYMEDVFQCTMDPNHQRPEDRVHMHENNHDIIHVHAAGATWGHLMANLGFGLGDDYIEIERTTYRSDGDRTLKFILNGEQVRTIRNQVIGDRDRLLISYGPESAEEVVAAQFSAVAGDAGQYNLMPDPASCAGQHEESFGNRLRRAVWF